MTDGPIDLAARRWKAAGKARAVTSRDTLVEALRQIDAGEAHFENIMIIAHEVDNTDDTDRITILQGGPANTNERIGLLSRALFMMQRIYGE